MSEAVAELLEKRAALAARQEEIKAEDARLVEDLAALDHILSLLDPSYEPSPPAKRRGRKAARHFARGELSAATLTILRDAEEPLTAADCAAAIVMEKALPELHCHFLSRRAANLSANCLQIELLPAVPLTKIFRPGEQ